MSIVINGTGSITGISAGGLNDSIITQSELATGVAGTGPAFSAYSLTPQTISHDVTTKLTLNAERFDTNNCFDTSLSRFTPNVAGYYNITLQIRFDTNTGYEGQYIIFYKNGSQYKRTLEFTEGTTTGSPRMVQAQGNILVYMNGTTDYIEAYIYGNIGSGTFTTGYTSLDYCNELIGHLVRAA